jgi:hypothetical protein
MEKKTLIVRPKKAAPANKLAAGRKIIPWYYSPAGGGRENQNRFITRS